MKTILLICLVVAVCGMLLCACVKTDSENTAAQAADNENQEIVQTETDEPVTVATDAVSSSQSAAEDEQPGSAIIAESSNTVSDKEKQEILDDLSEELESVLDSIGDLEDIDDDDLDIDDME